MRISYGALELDDDFPLDRFGFGVSVGFDGLVKRKGAVDVCFQLPLFGPSSELFEIFGCHIRHQHLPFLGAEGIGECACDEGFGEGGRVKEDAFGGQECAGFCKRQASREVEDRVKACGCLEEILLFVVDDVVCPERSGKFDALGGADTCDFGTHDLGDLGCEDADTARTSVE